MSVQNVPFPKLLDPPVQRAAYSDRTAWLMAVLSKLAYIRFEDATPLEDAATKIGQLITGEEDPEKQTKCKTIQDKFTRASLLSLLKEVADPDRRTPQRDLLEQSLKEMRFTLIDDFSVHIPFVADTQAYLAKLENADQKPFLVLAFRGTEPFKIEDLKTDLKGNQKILGYLSGPGNMDFTPADNEKDKLALIGRPPVKVHIGFWQAYQAIHETLHTHLQKDEFKDLPLYLTGHSLGGALAVVSTYAMNDDRIAACYTFGSPRVGNMQFGQRIKPPVYRVINASDVVTRLPPGLTIDILTVILRAFPVIPYNYKMADFLERFRGYRHYGSMRYLKHAEPHEDKDGKPNYPKLIVLENPAQASRWYWNAKRMAASFGASGAKDHAIDHYVNKLAYWANVRSRK